jgi:hypothetical protein
MKNTKLVVGLAIAIVVVLCVGVTMVTANDGPFKEPRSRPTDLPTNAEWDSVSGMYVLVEKADTTVSDGQANGAGNVEYQWWLSHRDSADAIDKAIVRYIENPDQSISYSSAWVPEKDGAFQREILPLGISKLGEMLQRIRADDVHSGLMMAAFARIARIENLKQVSVADGEIAKWLRKLRDKATAAKALEKAVRAGSMTPGQGRKAAEELGVLAMPYLAMQSKTDAGALDDLRSLSGKDLKTAADVSEDTACVDALLDAIINEN